MSITKEEKKKNSIGKIKKDKKEKKVKKEKKEKKEKKIEKKETIQNTVDQSTKKRKLEETVDPKSVSSELNKKRKLSTEKYLIVTGEEGKERFPLQNFDLHPETVKGLEKEGFTELFAVQAKTFEYIIEGRDVLVKARTGSGKTLAFALPSIEKLRRSGHSTKYGRAPRVIVLVPTRELAVQVAKVFEGISGNFSVCLLYGGVQYDSQERLLSRGCDVVVGTPGRIIDHLDRKNLSLSDIQFAILDEADEMLNFGFQEPIEKVLGAITQPHQTLLFSATVPMWVKDIAKRYLNENTITVDFIGQEVTQTSTSLKHLAIFCEPKVRLATLADIIRMYTSENGKTLVFANTKAEANEIAISSSISKESEVLHGDIAQKQREITLKGFRDSKFKTLIATDVAARGLDIDDIELVIQLQPPRDHETYIHRSGRTARAGKNGTCITFFAPWGERDLRFLETKAGIKFERIGTPQAEELIDSAADGAVKKINEVSEEMIPFFESYAQSLIEQHGEIKALAAALACISGHSQPQKERSLLTSVEGYTTILALSQRPIFSPKFICDVLSNQFDETVIKKIKDISLCEGGAVFDMPSDMAKKLIELNNNSFITFDYCKKLPQMKERNNDRRSSFGSSGGWRDGGGRSNNSRNSFGGGRNGSNGYGRSSFGNNSRSNGGHRKY